MRLRIFLRSLAKLSDGENAMSGSEAAAMERVGADEGEGPVSPDLIRSLREDGVILMKNALNAQELSIIRNVFDSHLGMAPPWVIDRSTEKARFLFAFLSPDMVEAPAFQRLWTETKLLDIAQRAFSTPEIWFWHEQIFFKEGSGGERVERTEWHQDLVVDPIEGDDLLRFWITLEPVEKEYALEFVRGSHRGPVYSVEDTSDAADDNEAVPMPDIDADRSQWDIVRWATEPGDILAFHPGIIHGGGSTKPDGVRRTLVTVFVGRDARYSPRPLPAFIAKATDGPSRVQRERLAQLRPGDPLHRAMPRLR